MRSLWIVVALATGCACKVDDQEPAGTAIGTFQLVATQGDNSCGTGAFELPTVQDLSVELRHDDGTLYWSDGIADRTGTLASDDQTISLTGSSSGQLGQQPNCQVVRTDAITGTIVGGADAPKSLSGTMRYRFDVAAGADCSLLEPSPTNPLKLPCEVTYTISGTLSP